MVHFKSGVIMTSRMKMVVGIAAVTLLSGTFAFAAAHFLQCSKSTQGNNVVVTFREAGLGNGDVTIRATANATANYACYNNGGRNPSAANKRTINATVSASSVFEPKNGSVRGSLTLTPPGPGDFSCPPGQTLRLDSVTYSNVVITDLTNGVSCNP
jgi:hypothetical protein